MDNTRTLDIPGATSKVEVEGVLGLFYKVRIGGEVALRRRGAWAVPMRGGKTARLTASGVIPGFQQLSVDGTPVLKMGAHVSTPEKIVMFAPVVLLLAPLVMPIPQLVLFLVAAVAVAMVFGNIVLVKNPEVPLAMRLAMPLVTAAIMAVALAVLFGVG